MKIITLFLGVAIPLGLCAQPNPDTLWTRTYGAAGDDVANSISTTSDGGFVIAGYTNSFGAGGRDAYLLKLDGVGELEWQRTYGTAGYEDAHSVITTSDGGYLICGTRTIEHELGFFVKVDSSGDTLWTKSYGAPDIGYGGGAYELESGGYVLVYSQRYTPDEWAGRACLITTDLNGNELDTAFADGSSFYTIYVGVTSVNRTSDGGCFLAGSAYRWTSPPYIFYTWDISMIKLDGLFGDTFSLSYNDHGIYGPGGSSLSDDHGFDGIQLLDSGYAVVGNTSPGWYSGVVPIRLTADGAIMWHRRYAGTGLAVAPDLRGGLVVAGQLGVTGRSNDIYLLGLNSYGDSVWSRTYGGVADDRAFDILTTSNSCHIIVGHTSSFGAGGQDIYVIKTGPDTAYWNGADSPDLIPMQVSLQAYPNPFNSGTILRFSVTRREHVSLTTFDVQGREVAIIADRAYEPGSYSIPFDTRALPSGIYFARLQSSSRASATAKLLLLK